MWKPLEAGDIVDVIAPGWAPPADSIPVAIEYIKSWGLVPRFDEAQLDPNHTPFACNSDKNRFQFLKKAVSAKDSKLIWCLRGGYGANRLIPDLLKMNKPPKEKILLGYSDVTTLHLIATQKWGWKTIHGPVLDSMPKERLHQDSKDELKEMLFATKMDYEHILNPINKAAEKNKSIKASLTGGNLIVLQSSLGTKCQVNIKNKILFLEDTGERGYRVDRMLHQLEQAGLIKDCKAVLFGDFLGGAEADKKNYNQNAINEFAARVKIPCFSGLQSGHGTHNRPLPCGVPVILTGQKLIFNLDRVFKK